MDKAMLDNMTVFELLSLVTSTDLEAALRNKLDVYSSAIEQTISDLEDVE